MFKTSNNLSRSGNRCRPEGETARATATSNRRIAQSTQEQERHSKRIMVVGQAASLEREPSTFKPTSQEPSMVKLWASGKEATTPPTWKSSSKIDVDQGLPRVSANDRVHRVEQTKLWKAMRGSPVPTQWQSDAAHTARDAPRSTEEPQCTARRTFFLNRPVSLRTLLGSKRAPLN